MTFLEQDGEKATGGEQMFIILTGGSKFIIG